MGTVVSLKHEVHESLTTQEVVTAVRDYLVTSGRIKNLDFDEAHIIIDHKDGIIIGVDFYAKGRRS